jgi:hypothetical protein
MTSSSETKGQRQRPSLPEWEGPHRAAIDSTMLSLVDVSRVVPKGAEYLPLDKTQMRFVGIARTLVDIWREHTLAMRELQNPDQRATQEADTARRVLLAVTSRGTPLEPLDESSSWNKAFHDVCTTPDELGLDDVLHVALTYLDFCREQIKTLSELPTPEHDAVEDLGPAF